MVTGTWGLRKPDGLELWPLTVGAGISPECSLFLEMLPSLLNFEFDPDHGGDGASMRVALVCRAALSIAVRDKVGLDTAQVPWWPSVPRVRYCIVRETRGWPMEG